MTLKHVVTLKKGFMNLFLQGQKEKASSRSRTPRVLKCWNTGPKSRRLACAGAAIPHEQKAAEEKAGGERATSEWLRKI